MSAALRLSKIRRSDGSCTQVLDSNHPLRRAASAFESMSQESQYTIAQELPCGLLNVKLQNLSDNMEDIERLVRIIESISKRTIQQEFYQGLGERCNLIRERLALAQGRRHAKHTSSPKRSQAGLHDQLVPRSQGERDFKSSGQHAMLKN